MRCSTRPGPPDGGARDVPPPTTPATNCGAARGPPAPCCREAGDTDAFLVPDAALASAVADALSRRQRPRLACRGILVSCSRRRRGRALRDCRAHRPRRHGRGVSGARHPPLAGRGAQGPARAARAWMPSALRASHVRPARSPRSATLTSPRSIRSRTPTGRGAGDGARGRPSLGDHLSRRIAVEACRSPKPSRSRPNWPWRWRPRTSWASSTAT